MKIPIVLLLLFVIFSCANPVSAECAWILWIKATSMRESTVDGRTDWRIDQSHTTLRECETFLKNTINGMREGAIRAGFLSRGVSSLINNSKGTLSICSTYDPRNEQICTDRTTRDFICLPDTIDPRERKK